MCISAGPAKLSNTIVLASDFVKDGQVHHLLGYQNSALSLSNGPNAMILPIPAAEPLTDKNCIDGSGPLKAYLQHYREVFATRSRSRSMNYGGDDLLLTKSVQVFKSGMYTVALASNAAFAHEALEAVPSSKRPELRADLLDYFADAYRGWPLAICCFSGEVKPADPLLWWYRPMNESVLFAPGMDAHSGGPPTNTDVRRDHLLVLGSTFKHLNYDHVDAKYAGGTMSVPDEVRSILPTHVRPYSLNGFAPNGDWWFDANVEQQKMPKPQWI